MPRDRWMKLFKKLGYWWSVIAGCWFVLFLLYDVFVTDLTPTAFIIWWLKLSVIANFPFTTAVVCAHFDWWGEKGERRESQGNSIETKEEDEEDREGEAGSDEAAS